MHSDIVDIVYLQQACFCGSRTCRKVVGGRGQRSSDINGLSDNSKNAKRKSKVCFCLQHLAFYLQTTYGVIQKTTDGVRNS